MINKDFKNQTKNECIHGSFNSRIKLGKSVFSFRSLKGSCSFLLTDISSTINFYFA